MSSDSADIDPQTSDDSSVSRPALTYLGPVGTYSHQVYRTPQFTGCALKASLTGCTRQICRDSTLPVPEYHLRSVQYFDKTKPLSVVSAIDGQGRRVS